MESRRSPGQALTPWLAAVTSILVVAALYFARDLLIPIALAMMLCLVLGPLVGWLERRRLGRVVSVCIAMALACALMAGVGWLVTKQVASLAASLPNYRENIRAKLGSLRGSTLEKASDAVKKIGEDLKNDATTQPADDPDPSGTGVQAEAPATQKTDVPEVRVVQDTPGLFDALGGTLPSLLGLLATLGIVVVTSIFLLIQRTDMRDRIVQLIGHTRIHVTTQAIDEMTLRVSRFLLAQTLLYTAHGTVVAVGLFFLDVPEPVLWGFLSAVLRFVPYVGPMIAAALPIALAVAVFPEWSQTLMVAGFFLVVEVVSNNVAEPWVYGASAKMSSLAVIVMTVFWTWLWGPAGLLLATPLTVCLVVMGRHVPQLRFLDTLLSDEPELDPVVRVYQRLLVLDRPGLLEVAGSMQKDGQRSLAEVYDTLLIPALRYLVLDRQRRNIEEERVTAALRLAEEVVEELAEPVRKQRQEFATAAMVAASARMPVLVLPARDHADYVVGRMLAAVLEGVGVPCEVAPADSLATEKAMHAEQSEATIVVISALPPGAVVGARYLVKRLETRPAAGRIVIGYWNPEAAREDVVREVRCAEACLVVTSMSQAELEVRNLALLDPVAATALARKAQ